MPDDLWRSRIRADAFLRPGPGERRPGTPEFVGKVVSTGAALGVGKFCRVVPVMVTGTETDGLAGVLAAGTAEVFAYPVGPGVPVTGDYVVCRRVANRWVFDKPPAGGLITVTPPGCGCTLSTTFTMTSSNEACNRAKYRTCGLTYATTCPYPVGPNGILGTPGWYSNLSFSSVPGGVGGCDYGADVGNFYYCLVCQGIILTLQGVVLDGPFAGTTFYVVGGGYAMGIVPCTTLGAFSHTYEETYGTPACYPSGGCVSPPFALTLSAP